MNVPSNLLYTREHEWLLAGADVATIGITDYAQNSLGDITFVELPKVGRVLKAGETFGVVESVKAASDLYAPIDCEVVEINEALGSTPEVVNSDPFEAGWMLRVKVLDPAQLATLLSPEAYETHIG